MIPIVHRIPIPAGSVGVGPGQSDQRMPKRDLGGIMIVLGIILLVVGYLLGIGILWTLGIILIVVGAILALLGAIGHPIGGRRYYY